MTRLTRSRRAVLSAATAMLAVAAIVPAATLAEDQVSGGKEPAAETTAAEANPVATRIDAALADGGPIVVLAQMPSGVVDALAVREARAGADAADATFIAFDVSAEAIARGVLTELGIAATPSLAVVTKKDAQPTNLWNGYVDRDVVAQAVENARR
jgi:hypothetical protein